MDKTRVEYHMEVYEESWGNDPSIAWSSDNPFPSVAVGDYFEHRGFDRWYSPPQEGERFQVAEVDHIFWEIEGSHVGHKLMVLLKKVAGSKDG